MFDDDMLKVGSNEMELVDFRILRQDSDGSVYEGIYGVNVVKVREIIKIPTLTELPNTPEYIEGIFDLRGVVIPVINLARWMGINEPSAEKIKPRVIISEFNGILIGFIVHEAKRIRRINWNDIEPASFSSGAGAFEKVQITGVTRIENGEVLLILDFETIVQELGVYSHDLGAGHIEEEFHGLALVLDDSKTARTIAKEALEKLGLHVIEAINGEDGLEKLENLHEQYGEGLNKELRLILSDVEMPRMDGFHFSARVKEDERYEGIPIIFNSSISDHFSEIRGQEAGGEAYLTKFNGEAFYKEIVNVLKKQN
jgi:two-component system chemotaxis response regulator CheV